MRAVQAVQMPKSDLILGDCIEVLKTLPENSIDLTVTSPPYDNLRGYAALSFNDFKSIAGSLFKVTQGGGLVVWIVADATVDGSETGTSFQQAIHFKEIGFKLHDTMIWRKGCGSPFQHPNRYISVFEYMFVLSKGRPKTTNLIRDRENAHAGEAIHGTDRQADNRTTPKLGIGKRVIRDFGARYNVWDILPMQARNDTRHPAMFPLQLAEDHISTWSNSGDTVLDPFMGSGTTGIAALNLGREFIGIEKDEQYFNVARERVSGGPLLAWA